MIAQKQSKAHQKTDGKKPKLVEQEDSKSKKEYLWMFFKGFGSIIVVLIPVLFVYICGPIKPSPIYKIRTGRIKPDTKIVINAKNSAAKHRNDLDVRWNRIDIEQKANFIGNDNSYEWEFKTNTLPVEYRKTGKHEFQVGFEGKYYTSWNIEILKEKSSIGKQNKRTESNLKIGEVQNGDNKFIKIKFTERINIDPDANYQDKPKSICITEDNIFILAGKKTGNIKIFEKKKGSLTIPKDVELTFNKFKFTNPAYLFYNRSKKKLEVIDIGARKVFIRDKTGEREFKLKEINDYNWPGYDMKFTEDGDNLIVSALTSSKIQSFGLYRIDIKTSRINNLLPSYEKYDLKNDNEYNSKYWEKQTIPATGVRAFIDIYKDNVFFVWEGKLRIVKFNLPSSKVITTFGQETHHYKSPNGDELAKTYIKKEFAATWKKREEYSYIKKIFATHRHVFLVYEIAGNSSTFRLQIYTHEGKYLDDVLIPGKPGRQMWLDKVNYDLYAFSEVSKNETDNFLILKYKIKLKK